MFTTKKEISLGLGPTSKPSKIPTSPTSVIKNVSTEDTFLITLTLYLG